MTKRYEVIMRYIVRETIEIDADSAKEAIEIACGESDTKWEQERNFKERVRRIRVSVDKQPVDILSGWKEVTP